MKNALRKASDPLLLAGFVSMVTVAPWLRDHGHPVAGGAVPLVLLTLSGIGSWVGLQETKAELREAKEEYRAAT